MVADVVVREVEERGDLSCRASPPRHLNGKAIFVEKMHVDGNPIFPNAV